MGSVVACRAVEPIVDPADDGPRGRGAEAWLGQVKALLSLAILGTALSSTFGRRCQAATRSGATPFGIETRESKWAHRLVIANERVMRSAIVMMLGLAAVCLAGAFAVLVAVRSYGGERSDFERWPPARISAHPDATNIAGLREVSFRSTDGIPISGWYAPSKNRAAVVLVHGTNADRAAVLPESRILANAAFGVLALDLPGQGTSGGVSKWGAPERHAIVGAVDWLAKRGDVDPNRIGALGVSLGGYVLVQAAAREPRLRALVLVSTPSDIVEETRSASGRWGWLSSEPAVWALRRFGKPQAKLQPAILIRNLSPRPILIVGGQLDPLVPEWMTRQLYEAAIEPKQLWIVSGGHHADYASVDLPQYSSHLVDFFSAALLR